MKNSSNTVDIRVHTVRNISSPEDTKNGRAIYIGQMPIESVIGLTTSENVRGYLSEAEGKQRKTPTQVHRAIRGTLENDSERFSVLNGGIVIVAKCSEKGETKDKIETLRLTNSSIINGSQTQGVIRDFLKENPDSGKSIHVKFELIVADDEDLVAEVSIARNFQNDVHSISIVGRRGQLDELEAAMQAHMPNVKLQKSETQWATAENDILQTEKLLQVLAALCPKELMLREDKSKVYTYSQKATCLREFQQIYTSAKDQTAKNHDKAKEIYGFYLAMAPKAWEIYQTWKQHAGFKGTRLRAIKRDEDTNKITEVPDGIVFPILSALSEFITNSKKGWLYAAPSAQNEQEIIKAAASTYMNMADSKPEIMGKSKACYAYISQIAELIGRLPNRG